jgi:hypothetical protein
MNTLHKPRTILSFNGFIHLGGEGTTSNILEFIVVFLAHTIVINNCKTFTTPTNSTWLTNIFVKKKWFVAYFSPEKLDQSMIQGPFSLVFVVQYSNTLFI